MNQTLGTKLIWGALLMFAVFGIGFSGSLFLDHINYEKELQPAIASGADLATAQEIPKYYYFNKNSATGVKVSALSYLVGDLDTGEIILAKNQDQVFPIASVTKLMTALVAKEINQPEEIAQVSKRALATYGGNGGFWAGEKIKVSDLLYPLLLESSNDAAEILAEHSDRETFLGKMNQQAEKLNMSFTSYSDPSGLSSQNQSTVSDLFKLAGFLEKEKPELLQITKTRSYTNKKHNWSSTNQFLRDVGYLGGKSGYTDPAKETVISIFSVPLSETGSRPVGIVLLQSKDRHKDVENIVNYLKKNIYYGGVADAKEAWVKQKDGIPEIREPDFVSFAFLGDIMLDRGVRSSVVKNFGGDYSDLFEKLDILKKPDVVFANLEGPASDKGEDRRNLYSFRMDPAVVPALKGAGIGILSVANNHVGDFGLPAYVDTLSRLKENEILYTGGGMNRAEAETPTIIEKYGMKIGFLAFSDQGPDWMEPKEDQAGLLLASDPRFDEIVQNAARQVNSLIVSFHFGEEYEKTHNARQEYLAHKAIDAGAKIIIGAHPHVVQDTEVYTPKSCTQSSCMGFIAYSLGNFIFDQKFSTDTMQGMLLELKLWRDGSISMTKDTVKLNNVFQPDQIIKGKEEKIVFTPISQ